ncbi:MAG: hypothetical protein U0936_09145 [Planctomycetaceae bacterium]
MRRWFLLISVVVSSSSLRANEEESSPATPIIVGRDPVLFADPRMILSAEGVRTRLHPPRKTGERLLISDKPWEDATLNWFSVLHQDGKFRMWYECYDREGWPTADDTSFCYAESEDGIRWVKPNLGLFNYKGSTENNILFRQIGVGASRSRVHGSGVFYDSTAPEASRFKCVSQGLFQGIGERPYYVAGMISPDGLNWTRLEKPICQVFADSQYSGHWNPVPGKYVLYGRVGGRGRAIGRSVSDRFESFPSLSLVLQTDDQHPPQTDLYNPACVLYPGRTDLVMMFPSLFNHQKDTLDIRFAVSNEGEKWTWPDRETALIPLGTEGESDSGSLYMANGCVEVKDEIWFYFGASRLKHEETNLDTLADPLNQRVYSRAVAKKDRLVSASAGASDGRFITPLLKPTGRFLSVTADIRQGGQLRVGLRDSTGKAVPGRALSDCELITSSCSGHRIRWKDSAVVESSEEAVQIEVEMRNADVFSFRFLAE